VLDLRAVGSFLPEQNCLSSQRLAVWRQGENTLLIVAKTGAKVAPAGVEKFHAFRVKVSLIKAVAWRTIRLCAILQSLVNTGAAGGF